MLKRTFLCTKDIMMNSGFHSGSFFLKVYQFRFFLIRYGTQLTSLEWSMPFWVIFDLPDDLQNLHLSNRYFRLHQWYPLMEILHHKSEQKQGRRNWSDAYPEGWPFTFRWQLLHTHIFFSFSRKCDPSIVGICGRFMASLSDTRTNNQ